MPDKKNEKILGGAVDIELVNKFDKNCFGVNNRKLSKKKLMKAFAKWFINLKPEEKEAFYAIAENDINFNFSEWINDQIKQFLNSPNGVILIADVIKEKKLIPKRNRSLRSSKSG